MNDKQFVRDMKGDLAVTYVRAVAAKCNYTFYEMPWSADKIGSDCTIFNFQAGSKPKITTPGNEIKIQVKGTSRSSRSMFEDKGEYIRYNLTEICPLGYLYYVVILELPEEDKLGDWLRVTPESLTMKNCAYYAKIDNARPAGFIEIPKSNLFTPESLPKLFISSSTDLIK